MEYIKITNVFFGTSAFPIDLDLFICCLFNDALHRPDYIGSYDKINGKKESWPN
jgi:hypothetical protein